jgi:hypothetical protein
MWGSVTIQLCVGLLQILKNGGFFLFHPDTFLLFYGLQLCLRMRLFMVFMVFYGFFWFIYVDQVSCGVHYKRIQCGTLF